MKCLYLSVILNFYSFPVHLIYEDIKSLARSREVGVRQSGGDFVFFFDDDVLIPNDYIKIALNFLEEKRYFS